MLDEVAEHADQERLGLHAHGVVESGLDQLRRRVAANAAPRVRGRIEQALSAVGARAAPAAALILDGWVVLWHHVRVGDEDDGAW